jgi:ferredoxin-type protein NapH
MNKKSVRITTVYKSIIYLYILFSLIIGVLLRIENNSENSIWIQVLRFNENVTKTVIILVSGLLIFALVKSEKKKLSPMKYHSYVSLTLFAVAVQIIPFLFIGIHDFNAAAMPLPWSSGSIYKLFGGHFWGKPVHYSQVHHSIILTGFVTANVLIFLGTIVLGRRLQCSMLCLFNGFAGICFEYALPVFGKNKKAINRKHGKPSLTRTILRTVRIPFFLFGFGLVTLSVLKTGMHIEIIPEKTVSTIEMSKYLIFEVGFMILFWIFFAVRGYCHYCPLGTFYGFVGRLSGQKIVTNETECIACSQCNEVCPMGLQIQESAQKGEPFRSIECVGCGSCIEACPKQTLRYTTHVRNLFLK